MKHYFSQSNNYWQKAPAEKPSSGQPLTVLEPNGREIRGFGVCFSELSYEALSKAQSTAAAGVMKELFSPEECGFCIGRIPIGASDFALSWYSCDETENDWELKDFSIERDKQRLIPLIRQAQAHCPEMKFFASPWSPPTWMKTHQVYNYGNLRNDPRVMQTYAEYLSRFVSEYRAEGIPVTMLHIQNEPSADQKFPSCVWSGKQMRDFIKFYLGPTLEKQKADTELWLGTINSPFTDYREMTPYEFFYDPFVHTVLADEEACRYVSGIGVQWGGKHMLDQLQASFPELRLMQTESECGDGTNLWEQVEYLFHTMWHYFRHGIDSYVYWNLALEKGAASTWGWRQNSLVSVSPEDGAVTYNPEFYMMKHFSHFVHPGAKLCPTSGHFSANTLVFRNADGSYAVIMLNGLDEKIDISLRVNDSEINVSLLPHTLNSLLIRA